MTALGISCSMQNLCCAMQDLLVVAQGLSNHGFRAWVVAHGLRCSKARGILAPQYRSVQSLSHVWLFATTWTQQTRPHQFPESTQTHVHRVSDAIQLSHPLSSPSLLALNLSQHQGLLQWVSSLHQVAKILEFQLQHRPSNEHPGLTSFRMDWLDLLAVQRTIKSLLQHHSSKASILQCSAFFIVQLSHPYMTTGKTIALTRQTFVGKVISLLLNMLSRLVITFLPRSKLLLISWLQSPSAVIWEPKK